MWLTLWLLLYVSMDAFEVDWISISAIPFSPKPIANRRVAFGSNFSPHSYLFILTLCSLYSFVFLVILFHLNFNPIYSLSLFVMPWAIKQFIQSLCEAAQAIKASAGTRDVSERQTVGKQHMGETHSKKRSFQFSKLILFVPNIFFSEISKSS